jgi:RNA polymerase sigma factor (sigma-70 family)
LALAMRPSVDFVGLRPTNSTLALIRARHVPGHNSRQEHRGSRDPDPVDELRHLRVPELLRRIRTAREAGEPWRAGREIDALIARSLPRVRNVVGGFRLPEHPGVAIRPDDREDVVQDALRRAFKMLAGFRGNAEGEWYAAVITCSRFTCRDHLRAQLSAERHLAGRLEDEAGEGRPRFEADVARLSEHASLDLDDARDAADWLAHALDRLPNPNQRRALELTRDGFSTDEIAVRLDTSIDNVHQLRSRGFAQLRKERR